MEKKKKNPDRAWYDKMCAQYPREILASILGSVVDTPVPYVTIPEGATTKVSLFKTDTVSALFAGRRRNPCDLYTILNFASYTSPGGGFLSGAKAQEESLCRESTLYPTLAAFKDVWYKRHRNEGPDQYSDDYILSPGVKFIRGTKVETATVLTMAAVNRARYDEADADIHQAQRMERAYRIMQTLGSSRIIVGAWGCGVFKNDPAFVAEQWKRIINKYNGAYTEVVIAVPDEATYTVFRKVFK